MSDGRDTKGSNGEWTMSIIIRVSHPKYYIKHNIQWYQADDLERNMSNEFDLSQQTG